MLMSGSAAFDPKPGNAAVAAINAAINALAKAFAEQGIKDGVQVNSVSPGAVMTGRRQSFFESGRLPTTLHGRGNPEISGESWHHPFRQAGGNCRPDELPRIPRGEVDDRCFRAYGRRRDQEHLIGTRRKQWNVVLFLEPSQAHL